MGGNISINHPQDREAERESKRQKYKETERQKEREEKRFLISMYKHS